jgi:hypothetical protein
MSRATVSSTDPIFAAIESREQTRTHYGDALERWDANGEPKGVLEKEKDDACTADHNALMAVLTTKPTTVAGTLALLEYLCALDRQQDDILEICDPIYDLDDDGVLPRGGICLSYSAEHFDRRASAARRVARLVLLTGDGPRRPPGGLFHLPALSGAGGMTWIV